jgi:hypothetical protein
MSSPRAVRYRRLALVEQDNEKAELLRLLADEADRGVLFTVEHSRYDKIEIPITSGDGRKWPWLPAYRRLFAATRAQPHDRVCPARSAQPITINGLPQSQRHCHVAVLLRILAMKLSITSAITLLLGADYGTAK